MKKLIMTVLVSMFMCIALVGPLVAVSNANAVVGTDAKIDKILVLKSDRKMYLMAGDVRVHEYNIDLGGAPIGHKVQQGDNKTPEGIYKISGRNGASSYYRSLRISYPNAADVAAAKSLGVSPGGDIFIHGLPNWVTKLGAGTLMADDWTLGCIALKTNAEMKQVWDLVAVGTVIEIKP